jgi:hypothetical protein
MEKKFPDDRKFLSGQQNLDKSSPKIPNDTTLHPWCWEGILDGPVSWRRIRPANPGGRCP